MKYQVKITETLTMTVDVEAYSESEALDKVKTKYWKEEIVVESSTGAEVEFAVCPVK